MGLGVGFARPLLTRRGALRGAAGLVGATAAALAIGFAAAHTVLAPPATGGLVAVAFDPWKPRSVAFDRVAEAGGVALTRGGGGMVFAISAEPGFADRLTERGALLVLDGAVAAMF